MQIFCHACLLAGFQTVLLPWAPIISAHVWSKWIFVCLLCCHATSTTMTNDGLWFGILKPQCNFFLHAQSVNWSMRMCDKYVWEGVDGCYHSLQLAVAMDSELPVVTDDFRLEWWGGQADSPRTLDTFIIVRLPWQVPISVIFDNDNEACSAPVPAPYIRW